MKKSIAKISIALIAIIVFPTLIFSVYEVSNISNNQQIVDSIYSSQLSSVVFAINQYSDDIASRWANSLTDSKKEDDLKADTLISSLLRNNIAVSYGFYASDTIQKSCFGSDLFSYDLTENRKAINKALKAHVNEIAKLKEYYKKGYLKIYPLNAGIDSLGVLIFALERENNQIDICGIVVNAEAFIMENLGPKMQSMGQDKFVISVFNKSDERQIYSSNIYGGADTKFRITEDLWIIHNYEIGIQLLNDPIEKMVNERTRTNIVLIVFMDLLLIIGAWFVYRNVKSQINLAQIKSEFVSNVSHELKTPLALINMYSETLEMGRVRTEEKKEEYIKVINKEANRLSSMVNKILNFARIENGSREYCFEDADLNDLVKYIIDTYQHHFKTKGFDYDLDLHPHLGVVKIDKEAVTDSINNLIDNAIKYSDSKKHISISTGNCTEGIFVAVRDSGIGIKDKDKKHIFEKFYRVTEGNLALKAKGSGIGLNIVKHIMDAHNAKIIVNSEFGVGTMFKLIFSTNSNPNSNE